MHVILGMCPQPCIQGRACYTGAASISPGQLGITLGFSLNLTTKGVVFSLLFCKHLMSTGLEPTSYAWLPHSLYVGCASGSVVIVDTATALKSRQQAQRNSQAGAVHGPALEPRPVEDLPGLGKAEEASLLVVAALEYGGQMIYVEALAVNKDCVAVAGHCPIIR